MTASNAPARAADHLREKAARLRDGARGKPDEAEKSRQADALERLAGHVAQGLDALRAALGPAGTDVDGITAADRERAGNEVYGLANRRAEKGQQRNFSAAAPAGWERGGHDTPIHRATLEEAAQLHELALALHYESYWDYLRGLLHETLGDFAGAAAILDGVTGHYAQYGGENAARCRRKAAGTWDQAAELDAALGKMLGAAKGQGLATGLLKKAFGSIASAFAGAKKQASELPRAGGAADAAPLEDARLERAERTAQAFAEHIAGGDFAAAHALLARALKTTTADDLREQWTQMTDNAYAGEDDDADDGGEFTVMVMTSADDMPDLVPADLGWIYVAITNEIVNEAVTVVVTEEGGEARIREIEWGRP